MSAIIKKIREIADSTIEVMDKKTELLENRIDSLERKIENRIDSLEREIGIEVGYHSAELKALIQILKRNKRNDLIEKLSDSIPLPQHKTFAEVIGNSSSNMDERWLRDWGSGSQLLDVDTITVGRPIQTGTVVPITGRGKRGMHFKKSKKRRKSKKSEKRKSKKSKRRKSKKRN